MGFERVSTLLAQERSVPSADEWDAARAIDFGIIGGSVDSAEDISDAVTRAVQEMHWLSIICFLEQVNPSDLVLLPDVAGRVSIELTQLRGYDPLEAYAAGLEVLCSVKAGYGGDPIPMSVEAHDAAN
jgi:hypothetical protein